MQAAVLAVAARLDPCCKVDVKSLLKRRGSQRTVCSIFDERESIRRYLCVEARKKSRGTRVAIPNIRFANGCSIVAPISSPHKNTLTVRVGRSKTKIQEACEFRSPTPRIKSQFQKRSAMRSE